MYEDKIKWRIKEMLCYRVIFLTKPDGPKGEHKHWPDSGILFGPNMKYIYKYYFV